MNTKHVLVYTTKQRALVCKTKRALVYKTQKRALVCKTKQRDLSNNKTT